MKQLLGSPVQLYLYSIEHYEEQPSSSRRFPSSHYSFTPVSIFPHFRQIEGSKCLQVKPDSMSQIYEHPSPLIKLESSQSSDGSLIPFPQTGISHQEVEAKEDSHL